MFRVSKEARGKKSKDKREIPPEKEEKKQKRFRFSPPAHTHFSVLDASFCMRREEPLPSIGVDRRVTYYTLPLA